jgi:hypothetical protein
MKKTTNQRKWTNRILKALEDNGFHPKDVQMGNGYFIFEHGEDMVVHFHIKECKGWKFGIWWNIDGDFQYDFFAQYERDIDKFKPTASTFVREDVSGDSPEDSIMWSGILKMVTFIHRHPYRAWKADQIFHDKIWELDDLGGAFFEFVGRWWTDSFRLPRVYEKMRKRYLRIVEDVCKEVLQDYKIVDENKDGWTCSPRYMITSKKGFKDSYTSKGNYAIPYTYVEHNPRLLRRWKRYERKMDRVNRKLWISDIWLRDLTVFVKGGK